MCDRRCVHLVNKVQSKKKSICDISELCRHISGPSLPVPAIVNIICLNMEDKVNSLKCEKTAQKGKITRLETYVQSITTSV